MPKKVKYPKVKKFLGSGSYKSCYALDSKRVALITDSHGLKQELNRLNRLKKAGVPVLTARMGKVIDESGEVTDALIAPRYDYHTFDFVGNHLNEKHLASLRKIKRKLAESRYDPTDIQFLVKKTGKIVVCDPGTLLKRNLNDNYSVEHIESVILRRSR